MTKFRKYTDQDIVRLPISPDMKTNPFVMGCCSCGAAHKAYFNYTNDKLYVRMVPDAEWTEVFRTDDAAKEPEIFLTDSEVKPMRNPDDVSTTIAISKPSTMSSAASIRKF
jgi:hypothetical protein